ncbi:GNAT family N-acetyltransferase [Nannocystis bainbridge]|uniref:GNAT family N-acetyltransferase n=1 Tax=Nannocystis bainbridge TaxID=2995303 RepID=A0ABT5DTJ2_9BACT|nr:GNAT family N-acetyltransferase [Nannocystis bainbridge]MDC0716967.1 GNAT family N-acetyltransferase [Nannocystis bainbridge]
MTARAPTTLGEPDDLVLEPSARALLSALVRELDGWTSERAPGREWLRLAMPVQGGAIEVPLARPFGVGRIAGGQARWRDAAGASEPLPLARLVARLVEEPAVAAALGLSSGPGLDRFVARVRASAANLEATVSARAADLDVLFSEPLGFIAAEQGLLLGHSVHPAPRLREGLGDGDDDLVPELRGRTPLCVWAVRRERLLHGGDEAPSLLARLVASDPAWAAQADTVGPEFVLLPLHPLQHRALLDDPSLEAGRRRGELVPLGPLGGAWSVTSSLRTLHRDGAPFMLKQSLPVRLTNSRRTLSLAELDRGLLLGRVLGDTDAPLPLHPDFHILREPAWFGLRDDQNQPGPSVSFFALRDNPFREGQPAEMLATLLQDDPRSGRSRLAVRLERAAARLGVRPIALAEAWFVRFLAVAFAPIVAAQAELGLLLSAHQQNLVIGFADDGLTPARAWFRDAQGTAYTELALRRHGERVPGLERAVFRAPLAERVWAYSVVINGVFNTVASLAMIPGLDQGLLLEHLRACLQGLRAAAPADPRAIDYLLRSPELWTKANARCFAGGVDEVSLADPLTIYRPIANPLHRAPVDSPAPTSGRAADLDGDVQVELTQLAPSRFTGHVDGARPFTLDLADDHATIAWEQFDPRARDLVSDRLFTGRLGLRHLAHVHAEGREIVAREAFYQRPLWHHRGESLPATTPLVQTGAIVHPLRQDDGESLLYRRHCAAIDRTFSLRRFDLSRDLDLFCAWMNDPVVAKFWEQAWPRAQLLDYIEQRQADPHTIPAIGWFDERPVAYYEIYWAKEDRLGPHYAADDFDRGFHMAIGDPEVRHRGWGRQWFLSMAHYLFLDDPRTQRLVGEPRVDQARVRNWANSTPWEEWGEVHFPHKTAVLMVLSRERFFATFEG